MSGAFMVSQLTNTIYAGDVEEGQVVTKQVVDAVVERLSKMPNMMEEYTWQINGKRYTLNLVEYTPIEKEAKQ